MLRLLLFHVILICDRLLRSLTIRWQFLVTGLRFLDFEAGRRHWRPLGFGFREVLLQVLLVFYGLTISERRRRTCILFGDDVWKNSGMAERALFGALLLLHVHGRFNVAFGCRHKPHFYVCSVGVAVLWRRRGNSHIRHLLFDHLRHFRLGRSHWRLFFRSAFLTVHFGHWFWDVLADFNVLRLMSGLCSRLCGGFFLGV